MRASNDRALLVGRPLGGRFGTDPAGTAAEAKALGAILLEAKILTGAQATEAAIKQLSGPLILHVATHGFFLADRKSATPDRSGLGLEEGAAGLKLTQDPPP